MTSCHGCHPGVWLDEKNRPCWQHSDVSRAASQFEPVFRQKFGPGPLQYRKKIFSCNLSLVKLKTLVRLNLDVEWHAHGHNQRETVSFVRRYLIAWISETQNTDRNIISSLFWPNKRFQRHPHGYRQTMLSHDAAVTAVWLPSVLWCSN